MKMRGVKCYYLAFCLFAFLSCCSAQSRQTTCTENSGKPCPEWLHKLIGQYPPLHEQVEEAKAARLWTLGDGRRRLAPDKTSWLVFTAGHMAAWGACVAAVRNPRSQEHSDEYAALGGLTALDTIFFFTTNPGLGAAGSGYPIYHYVTAARK